MEFKFGGRVWIISIGIILAALVIVAIQNNFFIEYDLRGNTPELKLKTIQQNINKNNRVKAGNRQYVLIYNSEDDFSSKLYENIAVTLKQMHIRPRIIDSYKVDNHEFRSTDTIILALNEWSSEDILIDKILSSVSNGTKLFIAYAPFDDQLFINYARKLGIYEIGDSFLSDSMQFSTDIMLGIEAEDIIKGEVVTDNIKEIHLIDSAELLIKGSSDMPILYRNELGQGTILLFSGYNLSLRSYRGIIAGAVSNINQDVIYPIIGSAVIFIDDFPGPMQGRHEKISRLYGRNTEDFIKDIWWPDMMSLGNTYNYPYTGVYIFTYNDVVEPPFPTENEVKDISLYLYGRELLRNDGEVILHGYNHQPLYFSPYVSEEFLYTYKNWKTIEYSVEAISIALERFNKAFPRYKLQCYVPPSNVMEDVTLDILDRVIDRPYVINGYFQSSEIEVPQQDFEIKENIIYFPRTTSGYFPDDAFKFTTVSAATVPGVISHFIHPDDIMDDERSKGLPWEYMRLELKDMFDFYKDRLPFLEGDTATGGANKLTDWFLTDFTVNYYPERIEITFTGTSDEYKMVLRSEKNILRSSDYDYEKIGDTSYYIVTDKPNIIIQLEENK